jgi:hypothetical protein
MLAAYVRSALAFAYVVEHDWDRAVHEASVVLEVQHDWAFPMAQSRALLALAQVSLCRGDAAKGLGFADRGLNICLRSPSPATASTLYLTRAEALHGVGRSDDAYAAIREARSRVLRIAATLDDPELRDSYLTNIVANARTLQLAKEWLGEDCC